MFRDIKKLSDPLFEAKSWQAYLNSWSTQINFFFQIPELQSQINGLFLSNFLTLLLLSRNHISMLICFLFIFFNRRREQWSILKKGVWKAAGHHGYHFSYLELIPDTLFHWITNMYFGLKFPLVLAFKNIKWAYSIFPIIYIQTEFLVLISNKLLVLLD